MTQRMSKPNIVIIIPARYHSTRLPGKPLAMIHGQSMIERCYRIARSVEHIQGVYVATDDARIQEHVQGFGGQAIMTPASCNNGSERAFAALEALEHTPEMIINFQGDTPLTPPWILQDLVDAMRTDSPPQIATPAVQLNWDQYESVQQAKAAGQPSATLVTFNKQHEALYFSKAMIPFLRNRDFAMPPVYKHIGIYAYQYAALAHYLQLAPTQLEQAESLEQLRALENGMTIKVIEVDYRGRTPWSVDAPEDIEQIEAILGREGELID